MKKFLLVLTLTLYTFVGVAQTTVYHDPDNSKYLTHIVGGSNSVYTASTANPSTSGNAATNVSSMTHTLGQTNADNTFALPVAIMPNGTNVVNFSFDYYTANNGGNNTGSGRYIVRLYNSSLGDTSNTVRENIIGTTNKVGGSWQTDSSVSGLILTARTAVVDAGGYDRLKIITNKNVNGEIFYVDNIAYGPINNWLGLSNDWTSTSNWSSAVEPVAADNVLIPAGVANYPTISTAAVANSVTLAEEASLLFSGGGTLTTSGNVTYQRTLTADKWYLMASPVVGESYDDDFVTANGIASGTGDNRGISTYDNTSLNGTTGHWRYFQAAGTTTSFNAAQGYGIRQSIAGPVSFVGTAVYTADQTIGISQGVSNYSLVANPFTGYLNLGAFFTDNATANLLAQNSIWVWDATNGNYDVLTSAANGAYEIAHGQAFFVEAGTTGGTVTFDIDDVTHQGTDTFQKTSNSSIKIFAEDENNIFRNASIYFIDGSSTGYDNGYDGQLFGGVSHSFALFSELLESNSKKYQVQSLPTSLQETASIPLGLIAEAGKTITFSADALNLPEGIKVFIEDRVEDTYTRLDEVNATYKVTLTEAADGLGRFYLHTSTKSALSVDDNLALDTISIYTLDGSTLRIVGLQQGNASVKIFNVLGKQVMNTTFSANGIQDISLPKVATGVYIVQLDTDNGKLNKKIILE